MDTKRLITTVTLGLGLIVLYYTALPWIDRIFDLHPPTAVADAPGATVPSTSPSAFAGPNSGPAVTTSQPASMPPSMAASPSGAQVVPASPSANASAAQLGSFNPKDGAFALGLRTQPMGAGVQSVVLNDFKESTKGDKRYEFQNPVLNSLDMQCLGSRSITVDNVPFDLAGVAWSVVSTTPTAVVYGADLAKDAKPLLALRKRFEVQPRKTDDQGYEISVAYSFENKTPSPMAIRTVFNGPTLPPPETSRSPDRQVVAGVKVDDGINLDSHPIEEFKPDKNNGEIDLTQDSKGHPARWAGAVSNYFGAIVLPQKMVGGAESENYIAKIVAHGVNIDKDTLIDDHQAYLTFETTDIKLLPGQPVTLPMSVFAGPRWRGVLDSPHYSGFPRQYNAMVAVRGSFSFCTFAWLTNGLIGLLTGIHWLVHDWGLAIIGLVAIVRIILHPITRRSQISMAKMGKMGPEMKRLQEKYKDDRESLNKAMVEFHKQQGLGPYLGCLPMFLQMPIWIALYGVLQSTFELRQAPFLGFTWIHDLAQPDYLYKFAHPVQIFFFDLRGINLLPVLLSAAMVAQQRFTPKPVAATPEQIQQQKMMQWLSPIMFLFFFYNLPSGLNLYIFTSTTVGVIESKIVRDHLKAREEAEKAGRVFVSTRPTRASRQGNDLPGPVETPAPRGPVGWLGSRWARLLEQAEQVRQQQQDPRGKKKA